MIWWNNLPGFKPGRKICFIWTSLRYSIWRNNRIRFHFFLRFNGVLVQFVLQLSCQIVFKLATASNSLFNPIHYVFGERVASCFQFGKCCLCFLCSHS